MWHECKSNIWSSNTKVDMSLIKCRLFTVCPEQVWYAASGLFNPSHWGGGGGEVQFFQAQDQQITTCSPRIVTECLLTRSMLIKMCVLVWKCSYENQRKSMDNIFMLQIYQTVNHIKLQVIMVIYYRPFQRGFSVVLELLWFTLIGIVFPASVCLWLFVRFMWDSLVGKNCPSVFL